MSTARITAIDVDRSYDADENGIVTIAFALKAVVESEFGAVLRSLMIYSSDRTPEVAAKIRAFADELDPQT